MNESTSESTFGNSDIESWLAKLQNLYKESRRSTEFENEKGFLRLYLVIIVMPKRSVAIQKWKMVSEI
jgi:hypothetical protein